MGMGWTLADVPGRLSWRALWAFLLHCPATSATYRERERWLADVQRREVAATSRQIIDDAKAMGW